MSDAKFTDEILMAFADGELDEETTRRVEAALEDDDELMARIAMFMETRAAASEALKPVLAEPVPDELVSKVRAMAAAAGAASDTQRTADAPAAAGENVVAFRRPSDPATPPQRTVSRLLMAMAACLLVVVGGAGGYLLRGVGPVGTGGVQMAGSVDPRLSAILNQAASGEEIAIGEVQGTVRLVSAFELATGQLCREYELAQPGEPGLVAVACRKASIWQTRLVVTKPEGGDGYAPASSLETVDAYLTSIGAGQPLDAEAEKRALAGK